MVPAISIGLDSAQNLMHGLPDFSEYFKQVGDHFGGLCFINVVLKWSRTSE